MIRNEKNGIVFYTFNNLSAEKSLIHLFSTRIGGVSEGKFASMNLSFSRGDDKENVIENFNRISQLGFSIERTVFSDQIHEVKIRNVSGDDCGKGILHESDIIGVDGLMTDEHNIVLCTFYADCVPLYFFDPVKKAIALSHAGWRGTLMEIGKITVNEMEMQYGSHPNDILVGIGPSICKNCFEVGSEVSDLFIEKFDYSVKFVTSSKKSANKNFIDLWGINQQVLVDAGVSKQNIELPHICTKCNPDIFYSHRLMGSERGSMAAFLSLTSQLDQI